MQLENVLSFIIPSCENKDIKLTLAKVKKEISYSLSRALEENY